MSQSDDGVRMPDDARVRRSPDSDLALRRWRRPAAPGASGSRRVAGRAARRWIHRAEAEGRRRGTRARWRSLACHSSQIPRTHAICVEGPTRSDFVAVGGALNTHRAEAEGRRRPGRGLAGARARAGLLPNPTSLCNNLRAPPRSDFVAVGRGPQVIERRRRDAVAARGLAGARSRATPPKSPVLMRYVLRAPPGATSSPWVEPSTHIERRRRDAVVLAGGSLALAPGQASSQIPRHSAIT